VSFAVGSLVAARGRDWVVLPGTTDACVVVRPMGGTDDEVTGILPALEHVGPTTFAPPDPSVPGDHRSAALLRDALRIGFRSSAGPFRSLAAIAVEPRPYQLVPLLMALRLDPVRMLIADSVGIGKTIEAGVIARELLDTGDARRLAVLCPPHLAEQWRDELRDKFHLDPTLVLASTAARLERDLPRHRTIFDVYPYVVVSMDFIKAERRRAEFVRTCPDLVIVDEAHTCSIDESGSGRARQLRFELLRELAADPNRHMLLLTATPHSGKPGAFRSLLSLLDVAFADLPTDLSGDHNRRHRERIARHVVQRQRGDIADFLGATVFPKRDPAEETYTLTEPMRELFAKVLRYCRETVRDPSGDHHRQRIRYWSALALLRTMASSPAAAAATLRTRAKLADTSTVDEAEGIGRTLFDEAGDSEGIDDSAPGAEIDEAPDDGTGAGPQRRRLNAFAREAEALAGPGDDAKLAKGVEIVADLVKRGTRPIVFCRFVATADYVADHLRRSLKGVEVVAVTGEVPAAEREQRIAALALHERRVLVATDCISEGVNLQEGFDAVVHYDLPWTPTRLEQREGRVDRFGQAAKSIRVVTYWGADNLIDKLVLDVLVRRHQAIRNDTGISVPVPGDTSGVLDALTTGLLSRDLTIADRLPGMEEFMNPAANATVAEWNAAADTEKRSRALFAQHAIQPGDVSAEIAAHRSALGTSSDVERFLTAVVPGFGGTISVTSGATRIDLSEAGTAVLDAVAQPTIVGRMDLPVRDGEAVLTRTHPFVAGLAAHTLATALDPLMSSPARRCGVMRTAVVASRTTMLVVRHRFQIVRTGRNVIDAAPLLAEDAAVLAFTGTASGPHWLDTADAEALLHAEPAGSVAAGQATAQLAPLIAALDELDPHLAADARRRADVLRDQHDRVREAARARGVRVAVEPVLPVDVLGAYVLLPVVTS
jgi:superfamily II DNA or RNA helicase